MVEGKVDNAVVYVNSETDFGRLWIGRMFIVRYKSAILIWKRDIDDRSIEYTIHFKIYLQILIDLCDLVVKP